MRGLLVATTLAVTLGLSSAAMAASERTLTGAAIGGGVGAVVAGPPGAIVGGAIGAWVGGPKLRPHRHCYWKRGVKHCTYY